jgi:hypothetical protein
MESDNHVQNNSQEQGRVGQQQQQYVVHHQLAQPKHATGILTSLASSRPSSGSDNYMESLSRKREKRRRSMVWNYFTVLDNNCAGRNDF